MKTWSLTAAAFALVATLASAPAHAQSGWTTSASADIGAAVPVNAYLNLSSSTISIPQPTAADVAAGVSKPAVITMSYGSNGTIALGYEFTGGTPFLTGAAGNQIPINRLRLSVDGGPSEEMSEFKAAWRGGIAPGDHAETLAIALALDYSVKPDTYSVPWEVILTAN
jgi:hypothetical protein